MQIRLEHQPNHRKQQISQISDNPHQFVSKATTTHFGKRSLAGEADNSWVYARNSANHVKQLGYNTNEESITLENQCTTLQI